MGVMLKALEHMRNSKNFFFFMETDQTLLYYITIEIYIMYKLFTSSCKEVCNVQCYNLSSDSSKYQIQYNKLFEYTLYQRISDS